MGTVNTMHVVWLALACQLLSLSVPSQAQLARGVGRLREVYAWKQITFDIDGTVVLRDRFGDVEDELTQTQGEQGDQIDNPAARERRQAGGFVFDNTDDEARDWNQRNPGKNPGRSPGRAPQRPLMSNRPMNPTTSPTTAGPTNDSGRFYIQYNNLPMGVERVGDRLFITLPRRRYGIPSTLNYINLNAGNNGRSPPLKPYPNLRDSRALTSVYRTRADECGRLWMVDTGLLEIPGNAQQVQQPAIVVYDLRTDRQIMRYPFKSSDLPGANTPTGLASITVDIDNGDCSATHAYIPDLATFGLIVYSLSENDSWRLTHNYFSFNPMVGNLNIGGQRFQWNDGIFSVTLGAPITGSCRTAYFHAMVGTTEFSVSTCVLKNRTASSDSNFWEQFSVVGDRGANSQSTMHGYHPGTKVVFFADIGRNAVSCWHTGSLLSPASVAILGQDSARMSYPSDLHVTGDEVWVIANSLPTWAYSRLNTDNYNFYVYRANVEDLVSGTVCSGRAGLTMFRSGAADGGGTQPADQQ